jgi:hypothetical protein
VVLVFRKQEIVGETSTRAERRAETVVGAATSGSKFFVAPTDVTQGQLLGNCGRNVYGSLLAFVPF